jgi:hypothetical protein
MNQFDRSIKVSKVVRAGGKSKKLEKCSRSWKKAAERRTEDPLMSNGSKHHRTEANARSAEGRTRGEAGGYSGVLGRKSQKAEGAIRRKSGWSRLIGSSSEK